MTTSSYDYVKKIFSFFCWTEWRSKTDDTNVYMSVKGVQHAFTAHVVGADNNYSTTAHDCSHGYTYSISNVGVYRMRN